MNKKFIALAVAGILAAPMAAQAEATLYGKFHVGIDSLSNTATGAATGSDISGIHVTSNASRIGVKGSEDLGGGLSAIYQMEAGVNLVNNSSGGTTGSNLAGRQSYLGLAGGWGAVLVGNLDSAVKSILKDPFADTVADANNILNSNPDVGLNAEDLRAAHAVAYATPNFSGVSAVIAYQPDQQKATTIGGANVKQDAWTGEISYNNGPIYVAYGYLGKKNADVAVNGHDLTVNRVDGTYDFGNGLKVGVDWDGVKLPTVTKRDTWVANATYTMGNNEFMAEYGTTSKNKDNTANPTQADNSAKMWALGVQNHMSKATSIYAVYGVMDNASGGAGYSMAYASGVTTAGGVTSLGAKSTAFAVGMVHKF